jgi:hypothetical protein
VIAFYYGSGSAKAKSYGSGSATLCETAIPILENDKKCCLSVYLETVRHHRLELQAGCIVCGGCELERGMVVLLLLLQLGQRGQRGIHAHHALSHLRWKSQRLKIHRLDFRDFI